MDPSVELSIDSASPALLAMDITEQVQWTFEVLFGLGPIDKESAVRAAADAFRDLGLCDFEALSRTDALYVTIDHAIETGVRRGRFDRPRRGHVRAIRAL